MELYFYDEEMAYLESNKYIDIQNAAVRACAATATAAEVLEHKTGICWAKADLLAALLRGAGIPCGICCQKLTLGDTLEMGRPLYEKYGFAEME